MTGYDLDTVPDLPDGDEGRYVDRRCQYLVSTVELSERKARALAWRELGYSHSGIAKQCDVVEETVDVWMADVADRFGKRALETRPQSNPVEELS